MIDKQKLKKCIISDDTNWNSLFDSSSKNNPSELTKLLEEISEEDDRIIDKYLRSSANRSDLSPLNVVQKGYHNISTEYVKNIDNILEKIDKLDLPHVEIEINTEPIYVNQINLTSAISIINQALELNDEINKFNRLFPEKNYDQCVDLINSITSKRINENSLSQFAQSINEIIYDFCYSLTKKQLNMIKSSSFTNLDYILEVFIDSKLTKCKDGSAVYLFGCLGLARSYGKIEECVLNEFGNVEKIKIANAFAKSTTNRIRECIQMNMIQPKDFSNLIDILKNFDILMNDSVGVQTQACEIMRDSVIMYIKQKFELQLNKNVSRAVKDLFSNITEYKVKNEKMYATAFEVVNYYLALNSDSNSMEKKLTLPSSKVNELLEAKEKISNFFSEIHTQ